MRRLLGSLLFVSTLHAAEPLLVQTEVFRSGEAGYHTYRIPSLITTRKGTLLAFCEGRKNSRGDSGDIDLLLKRSFDGGKTWTPFQVVVNQEGDTIGNPCPVVDRKSGTIWLLLTSNPGNATEKEILNSEGEGTRSVWLTHSRDDGASWASPVEITQSVKLADWTWYATGPGNGIQLKSGRMVIPCDHARKGTKTMHSHVVYSDDYGRSWKLGGVVGEGTNECQLVELVDGTLMINMRNYLGLQRRVIATSQDGGLSWSELEPDAALIDPVCQASFLRFTLKGKAGKSRLLFSNPADIRRVNMTLQLSYDEGKTWPIARQLHEGPAAYSSLAILKDQSIGCLYERGETHPYERITFARFNLEWLSNGRDHLKK